MTPDPSQHDAVPRISQFNLYMFAIDQIYICILTIMLKAKQMSNQLIQFQGDQEIHYLIHHQQLTGQRVGINYCITLSLMALMTPSA